MLPWLLWLLMMPVCAPPPAPTPPADAAAVPAPPGTTDAFPLARLLPLPLPLPLPFLSSKAGGVEAAVPVAPVPVPVPAPEVPLPEDGPLSPTTAPAAAPTPPDPPLPTRACSSLPLRGPIPCPALHRFVALTVSRVAKLGYLSKNAWSSWYVFSQKTSPSPTFALDRSENMTSSRFRLARLMMSASRREGKGALSMIGSCGRVSWRCVGRSKAGRW